MTAAIRLSDVSAAYEEAPVLRDVALEVASGELVAVVGRSGCGKTTLLRVVAGLLAPSTGRVNVHDGPPAAARRRKAIGLIFQDTRLHPWLTVRENVALPLRVNPREGQPPLAEADAWIERVGLGGVQEAYPHELSGGMRQRVGLARALVLRPDVLLMDEPLGSLDELTREDMRFELLELWGATASSILYVTHDLAEAVLLADRVVVLAGRPARVAGIVEVGLPRPRERSLERSPVVFDAVDRLRELLA